MIRFRVGDVFSKTGIFCGNEFHNTVISRDAKRIKCIEKWVAEDSGKVCFAEVEHAVEEDENHVSYDSNLEPFACPSERVAIWTYKGETGYVWASDCTHNPKQDLMYSVEKHFYGCVRFWESELGVDSDISKEPYIHAIEEIPHSRPDKAYAQYFNDQECGWVYDFARSRIMDVYPKSEWERAFEKWKSAYQIAHRR